MPLELIKFGLLSLVTCSCHSHGSDQRLSLLFELGAIVVYVWVLTTPVERRRPLNYSCRGVIAPNCLGHTKRRTNVSTLFHNGV